MNLSLKDLFPFMFTLVENGLLTCYANSYLNGLVEKKHFRQGIVDLLETGYTSVDFP